MGKSISNRHSRSKSKTFKSHSSYRIPLKTHPDPTQERLVRLITSKRNTIREAERSIAEAERATKKAERDAKKAISNAKKESRRQIIPERISTREMKAASYYNPEEEAARQREMERRQREINNARKEANQQSKQQLNEMDDMFGNFGIGKGKGKGKGNKSKRRRRRRESRKK